MYTIDHFTGLGNITTGYEQLTVDVHFFKVYVQLHKVHEHFDVSY